MPLSKLQSQWKIYYIKLRYKKEVQTLETIIKLKLLLLLLQVLPLIYRQFQAVRHVLCSNLIGWKILRLTK